MLGQGLTPSQILTILNYREMKNLTLTLFLSLFLLPAFSQKDDWIRVFWEYKKTTSYDLIETYDKGYLILGAIRPDPGGGAETWSWLIKTDINGEVLWEKKIGKMDVVGGLHDIHQTLDGGYILSGGTTLIDQIYGDPFFMKLNACGEKEWCKIFYSTPAQYSSYSFAYNVYPAPGEDGYIALVHEFDSDINKEIWLIRLSEIGDLIWAKHVFYDVHPDAWNELAEHMYVAADGTLIITATTIYNDFGGPAGHDKPFILAANPDGTEKWWTIYHADSYKIGQAKFSTNDSHGNILTMGWGMDLEVPPNYFPSLLKTDMYGNQIFSKYIIDSVEGGKSFCLNIMNDTLYDIGGGWWYPGGEPGHAAIARTDTNGNLIMEKLVLETNFVLAQSIKTFDNKELFVGPYKEGSFTKIYLHKFNSDLEYDTIYTQPFDYDYMCENLPIVSDTIGIDDCDIWTSLPGEIEYRLAQYLVIYPNPAKDKITVRLPTCTAEERPWGPFTSRHFNHRYFENSVLRMYDGFGRQVKEISLIHQQENELKIDVSELPSGIYLMNLYENEKKMASGKFVKN